MTFTFSFLKQFVDYNEDSSYLEKDEENDFIAEEDGDLDDGLSDGLSDHSEDGEEEFVY